METLTPRSQGREEGRPSTLTRQKSEVETSVLFELISHRYEMKSLLITANQTFSEWDSIFADATMTVAAVDRLVHHATIIEIRQESFRKKTALSRSHLRESNSPE